MRYADLVQLYFERSNALQSYWTLYVVVIGGLLGFASMRKERDRMTTIVVSVLYLCFAYKNCTAIRDGIAQRNAALAATRQFSLAGLNEVSSVSAAREQIEPTMLMQEYPGIRNFHIACDVLTVIALWTMELRRKRYAAMRERELDVRSNA